MRRREFITLLVGATAAWPLMSRAQGRTARVGVLMVVAETDPESERLAGSFEKGLDEAGWHKGRNLELLIGGALPIPTSSVVMPRSWCAQRPIFSWHLEQQH